MKVYIGYDSRQDYPPKYDKVKNPCYEVCKSSILKYNKDIEIQPLNEFIIKRNDDSATTPNVVNITDDIVALQTSIFDLTASDKITIKSI